MFSGLYVFSPIVVLSAQAVKSGNVEGNPAIGIIFAAAFFAIVVSPILSAIFKTLDGAKIKAAIIGGDCECTELTVESATDDNDGNYFLYANGISFRTSYDVYDIYRNSSDNKEKLIVIVFDTGKKNCWYFIDCLSRLDIQ